MPDWLSILKAYVDTLETAVGAVEGATTLHNKLTAARALLLDQITALRMAELDAVNLPADLDTLLARLTAARAGYLDELAAANIPADVDTLLARLTALRAGYLDNLSGGAVALAASWTAALATALGNYTAARAAYLDELAAANIPADIDTLLARLTAARAGYLDELAAANIPADVDTLLARLTALRAGYLDNLSAGAVALAATALSTAVWTAARGGYLDELAAANLPTDIDGLKTSRDRQLFSMDFWSAPQEEVAIPAVAGTLSLPTVTVADLPAGATIVRAIAMVKFRIIDNINAGANKLDGATVAATSQVIQVRDDTPGTWRDAITFVDDQFGLAASTREGGDVLIGATDIAIEVDANDGYNFQYLLAKADLLGINWNDVQVGLRIWYSV